MVSQQVTPDVFENPIFSLHLKSMRFYGFISDTKQRHSRWNFLRCCFFTLSIVASTCLMLAKVARGFEHLENGATTWATTVQFLAVSVMTTNACFQQARVIRLVAFVHEDLKQLRARSDEVEDACFGRTVRYLHLVTGFLWVPSLAAGLIAYADLFYRTIFLPEMVFNVPQILNGTAQPILIFQLFPFGEIYDNFFVGYLGACYALYLGITTIPIWHTFMTCLMKYVIVKFEILNLRLEQMDISKVTTKVLSATELQHLSDAERDFWRGKLYAYCVTEQIKLRWFVNELQTLIRLPVFVDFIIFSVLICFLFYAISVGNPSNMESFFMLIYVFVMVAIMWLYHWHATIVGEMHDKLRFAIYSSDWYNYPVALQKSVRLIMLHSMTPLRMRAFFVDLNLNTFIAVVRGAYSYFSILRNANHAT